ncbi:MAG: chloride channel protein [Deltaproteobacteria bacterium]|nr:chloride channel protein [Deltaproteobacteria bacterium]
MVKTIKNFLVTINQRTIYLYSLVTGILAGLVSVVFYQSVHFLNDVFFAQLLEAPLLEPTAFATVSTYPPSFWQRILFFLIPALGGLAVGLISQKLAPEATGSGTEAFLDAFHNKSGIVRKRTSAVKLITSIATLGTGGSGGKEGPMMLIGSGLGSLIGRFIRMGARAQRTLLLAGAAGGLGAIFRTPLGGAITAVEVLYKEDFESDALIPCIIASVTAYTTFGAILGFGHTLTFTANLFHSPLELVFYVALAVFCTSMAYLFVRVHHFFKNHFFTSLPVAPVYRPAVGGLMVGLIGLFFPDVIGGGLGVIQQAIYGTYSSGTWYSVAGFFFLLAVLKMFSATFTVQSGGSAGLLIPAFFIGGMLGGCVGTVFHHFFPALVPSATPYIVVGMSAFFAAATNASLGALVMVTELTGGYELLPPLMVVAVISLIFSHRWSIYKNQVANKFYSKAHLWDMSPAILKSERVKEAFSEFQDKAILGHRDTLKTIREKARRLHDGEFIVKNDENKFMGLLTLHDLEFEDGDVSDSDIAALDDLCVAEDMLHSKSSFLYPTDTLFKAMKLLSNINFDKAPVVDTSNTLLGYITRKDILKHYNELGNQEEIVA